MLSLGRAPSLAGPAGGLRKAGPCDADAIYAFLQQIEGFAAMYASKEMLVQRLDSDDGIHLVLEAGGHILAHANSTVATRQTVVLGGVATRADMRGRGFASAVVSELCRCMQAKGRSLAYTATRSRGMTCFCAWALHAGEPGILWRDGHDRKAEEMKIWRNAL